MRPGRERESRRRAQAFASRTITGSACGKDQNRIPKRRSETKKVSTSERMEPDGTFKKNIHRPHFETLARPIGQGDRCTNVNTSSIGALSSHPNVLSSLFYISLSKFSHLHRFSTRHSRDLLAFPAGLHKDRTGRRRPATSETTTDAKIQQPVLNGGIARRDGSAEAATNLPWARRCPPEAGRSDPA
jgi:hypothetical protein